MSLWVSFEKLSQNQRYFFQANSRLDLNILHINEKTLFNRKHLTFHFVSGMILLLMPS